ncbi:hypothetical protein ILUMI_15309 [Ignelater luminosus]|uniref:PiggyBac transposable element-derived protein domain-containing protein n=1 Tax=Ignelater luminosus TaxID=2038154 RepID=A0A8K0G982_IGNLU|nr:hypothetical protein ILUMI_15309 [Ignelater luminosus]
MSQKRFDAIRASLHFNDNTTAKPINDPDSDRLHKIRSVVYYLNTKFATIPFEQFLCVDEQLWFTKARLYLKVYLPIKPHKWGAENRWRLPNEPDLEASANIVVRLCRGVPSNQFYKLDFDNYYSPIPIVSCLSSIGIYPLGTVRRNRIPICKILHKYVATVNGSNISTVVWKDNRLVLLVSQVNGQFKK